MCVVVPGNWVGEPGSVAGVSGVGRMLFGVGRRVSGAVAGAVLLGPECCHLSGEVLYFFPECGVGRWPHASERRLRCSLSDAVCAAGGGFQTAIILAGEYGPYVGRQPTGPDGAQDILGHVGGEGSEMPQELRRFTVTHLLDRDELVDALLLRGGQPPHELGPERGVGIMFGRRGDDVRDACRITLVQLRDCVIKFRLFVSDVGQ